MGRLPGAGTEDRDPARGARQDHVPARARPGSRRESSALVRGTSRRTCRPARDCRSRSRITARGPCAHRARSFRARRRRIGRSRESTASAADGAHGRHRPGRASSSSGTWGSTPCSSRFRPADEDFHAPNEFFRVHRLHEGLEAWARLWDDPRRGARMTWTRRSSTRRQPPTRASRSRRRSAQRVAQEGTRRPRPRADADPLHRRPAPGSASPASSGRRTSSSGCSRSCSSTCRRPPW